MDDKEINCRNVIKSTQVDPEWIASHGKERSRIRTENKIHWDSHRCETRVPRKINNSDTFLEELFENLSLSPGDNWQVWILIHSLVYDFSWTLKCVVLCYVPLSGGERLRPSWGRRELTNVWMGKERPIRSKLCMKYFYTWFFLLRREKWTEIVCGIGRPIYSTYIIMALNKNIQCREQSLKISVFFIKLLMCYLKT